MDETDDGLFWDGSEEDWDGSEEDGVLRVAVWKMRALTVKWKQ